MLTARQDVFSPTEVAASDLGPMLPHPSPESLRRPWGKNRVNKVTPCSVHLGAGEPADTTYERTVHLHPRSALPPSVSPQCRGCTCAADAGEYDACVRRSPRRCAQGRRHSGGQAASV